MSPRSPLSALLATAALAIGALPLDVEADEPEAPRIVVTGRGQADAAPDHAVVTIGATARAATAAAALDETSAAAGRVAATVRAFGVDGADIRTGTVGVQPLFKSVRDGSGGARQQPDGFQATNGVAIRLRDLPRLGELLRRVAEDGATQVSGVQFGVTNRAAIERAAAAAAVASARSEAEALAAAAGVRLGRLVAIRSGGGGGPRPLALGMEAMRAAPAPDVPVEPGRVDVSASVEMTWAIEGP